MIDSGLFKGKELVLVADSTAGAKMAKSGLAGKNNHLVVAPYGTRVDIEIDGSSLVISKASGNNFTYEEVLFIVKKIQTFGALERKPAENITNAARKAFKAGLTLFYPSPSNTIIDLSLSYNWASIKLDYKNLDEIKMKITEVIGEKNTSRMKVHSNDDGTITLHNYSMQGIYINRNVFNIIADVLCDKGLIDENSKPIYTLRSCAFGAKSTIYMEARKLCKSADETFNLANSANYNPLVGKKEFVQIIMNILLVLSKEGAFDKLTSEQKTILQSIVNNLESIEKYSLAKTIKMSILSFVNDFSDEINAA